MAKNEVKMLKINNSNINSEIVKIKNKKNKIISKRYTYIFKYT